MLQRLRQKPPRKLERRRWLNSTPHTEKKTRTRRCIVSGDTAPPDGLIRFVLDPEGAVAPDLAENLPGRGAWVSAKRSSIERAVKTGAFNRAFRGSADVDGDLAEVVEERLKARALSALGLLRRAGVVAIGFDQVGAALKEKNRSAALLLTASDAADGGAEKLARLARGLPVVRALDVDEISAALGRDGVRHAVVKERAETAKLTREILRFARFASQNELEEA